LIAVFYLLMSHTTHIWWEMEFTTESERGIHH